MPAQPRKAATKGRRDPSLLTAGPEMTEPLAEHITDDGTGDGAGEMEPTASLLVEGDIVTCSVTLAIDLMGDGRTSFVGYKATTKAQHDEDAEDVYNRLGQVVNSGLLTAVDDTIDSLNQYEQLRAQRRAELERITG